MLGRQRSTRDAVRHGSAPTRVGSVKSCAERARVDGGEGTGRRVRRMLTAEEVATRCCDHQAGKDGSPTNGVTTCQASYNNRFGKPRRLLGAVWRMERALVQCLVAEKCHRGQPPRVRLLQLQGVGQGVLAVRPRQPVLRRGLCGAASTRVAPGSRTSLPGESARAPEQRRAAAVASGAPPSWRGLRNAYISPRSFGPG